MKAEEFILELYMMLSRYNITALDIDREAQIVINKYLKP